MKLLFIPLDERPCNYIFPQLIGKSKNNINLMYPQRELLGKKKQSANIDGLWEFLFKNAKDADAAILSVDMLMFGGLIPSRVHKLTEEVVDVYYNNFIKLKQVNPNLKLYVYECIMRSPQTSTSEEEPDYYAEFGYEIHRRAYLIDKKMRHGLSNNEIEELNSIFIPKNIINDYEERRDFNLNYNLKIAGLVKEGIIDFLVIPQDDAAKYGYTAIAQKKIIDYLSEHNLEDRVSIYPGADEVAASLLARCLNDLYNRVVKIYPFYASVLGPTIVPSYEDRPMHENLKYHVDVCGARLVDRPEDSDFVLAINSPGLEMEGAQQQIERDITYTSYRNLMYFVKEIERYLQEGYKVAICDSAYSNGGDLQLIKFLDQRNLLHKLLSYGGWNTNSNTLGTVLSNSIFSFDNEEMNKEHLVYRIIEDVFYQADVRQVVIDEYLPKWNLSFYDFKNKQNLVENKIKELLTLRYNSLNLSKEINVIIEDVYMPWERMFEVGLKISL